MALFKKLFGRSLTLENSEASRTKTAVEKPGTGAPADGFGQVPPGPGGGGRGGDTDGRPASSGLVGEETRSVYDAWEALRAVQEKFRACAEEMQWIGESVQHRDRAVFDEIGRSQDVLAEALARLRGHDLSRTADEVDDLIASRFAPGGVPGVPSREEVEGALRALREKARSLTCEMNLQLEKGRDSLALASAAKAQVESSLAVAERAVAELSLTREMAGDAVALFSQQKQRLDQELETTTADRKRVEAQVSLLEERIQRLQAEKEGLEDRSAGAQLEKSDVESKRDAARGELEDAEEVAENLMAMLADLETERDAADELFRESEKARDDAVEGLHLTEKALADKRRAAEASDREAGALRGRVASLTEEAEELERERSAVSARLAGLEEEVLAAELEMEGLAEQLARLLEEKDGIEEKLETEKGALREMGESLEREIAKRDAAAESTRAIFHETGQIQSELTMLRGSLEDLLARKKRAEAEYKAMVDSSGDPAADRDALARLNNAKAEKERVGRELKEVETEVEELESGVRAAREEIARTRKSREQAAADALRSEEAVRTTEAEIARARERASSLDEEKKELEKTRSTLAREEKQAQDATGKTPPPAEARFEVETVLVLPAPQGKERLSSEEENAARLARVTVSDIVLYNKSVLANAANQRNFYQVLDGPIKKSEDYFREKVPAEILKKRNFLREELEKLRLSLKQ